jgi:hypothetical protein
MLHRALIAASCFLLARFLSAGSKPVNKAPVIVDEGAYAIFQNGVHVATEEFTIRQFADSNITSSHLRSESGSTKFEQTSELTLLPNGAFSHYAWKELSPARSSAEVESGDHVLVMHATGEDGKPLKDQSFFLTAETFILDDYFFSTREVLMWRYLATSCKPRTTGEGCDLVRQRFPILIPRQRLSSQVYVEFKGYDDIPLNGRPQHLRHLVIQPEGGSDWHLWLNDAHKLLRISIPDANTEVLRQEKPATTK